MQKVAIVGVGLIGASFGLALRKAGFTGPILGVSSAQAVADGLQVGAISQAVSLVEAVQTADLIYLAQPVDRIISSLALIGPIAPPDCLITDAGSTKVAIVQAAAQHVKFARFVGGHPMAGKESRGALAADATLFAGRPYILEAAEGHQVTTFRDWVTRIGANIIQMTPQQHDSIVALTSHLPQMLSSALAACLAQKSVPALQSVYGSGLLDMTRLALSPADLWSSIFATNAENVRHAIDDYISVLIQLKDSLGTRDFDPIFDSSSSFARELRKLPR